MARDIEQDLGLAQRVISLRAAAKDPDTALAYVQQLLREAEEAYSSGRMTTRSADAAMNGSSRPKRGVSRDTGDKVPKGSTSDEARGLTEKVDRLFDDERQHHIGVLATELGVTRRQMKRAINRLWHVHKTIKHIGPRHSGTYVRTKAPAKGDR